MTVIVRLPECQLILYVGKVGMLSAQALQVKGKKSEM